MSEISAQKPWWKSTNFILATLMVAGSFFGAPESLANTVVVSVVGVIAAVGAVRQFLPDAKFKGWKNILLEPNTWNYLTGAVATIGIPKLAELVPELQGLSQALVEGNWSLVITRGFALLTILFYLFRKQ